MMQLILASASPRRQELLAQAGFEFCVQPSGFEEAAGGSAEETARRNARGKAREVFSRFPACLVLGADTVVECGGEILGKPKDMQDAARMLRLLSGRTHSVLTGVCAVSGAGIKETLVRSRVTFFPLAEEQIGRYLASGLPMDKAGAYGIQDGFGLVRSVEGSYTNVVGLPVEETVALLKASGGTPC